MAWAIAVADAVRAERFMASAVDVERAPLAAALLRDAEAVLALPSIHTIPRYPFALMEGALAALFQGSYRRDEELCAETLRAAQHPSDEVESRTAFVRANIARFSGEPSRAIEHQERALRHVRRSADPYQLVRVLNVLAAQRRNDGDFAKAVDEASEALNLARQIGNPGLTSGALAGLAYVLANFEPERSRALIVDSLEINNRLGGVDEFALVLTLGRARCWASVTKCCGWPPARSTADSAPSPGSSRVLSTPPTRSPQRPPPPPPCSTATSTRSPPTTFRAG